MQPTNQEFKELIKLKVLAQDIFLSLKQHNYLEYHPIPIGAVENAATLKLHMASVQLPSHINIKIFRNR